MNIQAQLQALEKVMFFLSIILQKMKQTDQKYYDLLNFEKLEEKNTN